MFGNKNETNDYLIKNIPTDTISQLNFYPDLNNHILISGSWDCRATIWKIQYSSNNMSNQNVQITENPIHQENYNSPILCVGWHNTQSIYFAGLGDGTIMAQDIQNKNKFQIGKHDIGCRDLAYIPNMNVLITSGWDKKILLWDLRYSGNPAITYNAPDRISSMSVSKDLLVFAMNNKQIGFFNLSKYTRMQQFQPENICNSHLNYQTRKVCCFNDGKGYALGSIEGRVAIKYIDLLNPSKMKMTNGKYGTDEDFSFRCHRIENNNQIEVYPVNDIAFNPKYGSFATVGGDGSYTIWEYKSKSKIKEGSKNSQIPLTACAYSLNGELFAYASGYDWSRGANGYQNTNVTISIHYLQENERKKGTN